MEGTDVEFLKLAAEHGLIGLLIAFLVGWLTRTFNKRIEDLEKTSREQVEKFSQTIILLQENNRLLTQQNELLLKLLAQRSAGS